MLSPIVSTEGGGCLHWGMLSPPLLNTGEGSPLGMLSPMANVGGVLTGGCSAPPQLPHSEHRGGS